jgi:hypothetical protein
MIVFHLLVQSPDSDAFPFLILGLVFLHYSSRAPV